MISFDDFDKVDIRLGKVIATEDFPEARKPAIKLTIDFGSEIGTKRSSAQLIDAHTKEELVGILVMCVVNFLSKQVGPFVSEVLTLGFQNHSGTGWVLATVTKPQNVQIGDRLR
ncbi:tRNA-binding protein [bacterium]|nr:tRNA-binding protein [bacterium]